MTINRLVKGSNASPAEVAILRRAFDDALRVLGLVDRNDPLAEMVARTIIKVGEAGVRDPAKISEIAVKELLI